MLAVAGQDVERAQTSINALQAALAQKEAKIRSDERHASLAAKTKAKQKAKKAAKARKKNRK